MPDLDKLLTPEQQRLVSQMRRPTSDAKDWFRIEAAAGGKTTEVWIYDRIGSDLFEEGTDAKSFARQLANIKSDEILLHLNSKGGDATDGVAIYNSLKDHKAKVMVRVDGVAASAASLIAMAGDVIQMNSGATMMIHDAGGIAIGNANVLREFAVVLDKLSDSYAEIYAERAGGDVAEWRERMSSDKWYTADEAVEAGLADEKVENEPAEAPANVDASTSRRHRSRISAAEAARHIHAASVKQTPDATPARGRPQNTEGAAEMQFTDEERAALRARFSLPEGADDDAIKAALLAPAAQPNPEPAPEPTPAAIPEVPEPKPELVHASGTITIDASAWKEREDRIKRLEAQDAKRRREERDQVLAQAVADGKFPPARKEHWVRLWDADPEGTRQVVAGLARNVVPTAELGYAGDVDAESIDAEFAHLFPPALYQKGA